MLVFATTMYALSSVTMTNSLQQETHCCKDELAQAHNIVWLPLVALDAIWPIRSLISEPCSASVPPYYIINYNIVWLPLVALDAIWPIRSLLSEPCSASVLP